MRAKTYGRGYVRLRAFRILADHATRYPLHSGSALGGCHSFVVITKNRLTRSCKDRTPVGREANTSCRIGRARTDLALAVHRLGASMTRYRSAALPAGSSARVCLGHPGREQRGQPMLAQRNT